MKSFRQEWADAHRIPFDDEGKGTYRYATVYGCREAGDGYKSGPIIAYFDNPTSAREYGKVKNGYGQDCAVEEFTALWLQVPGEESTYLILDLYQAAVRLNGYNELRALESAYSKLTPEEIKALGVPDKKAAIKAALKGEYPNKKEG